MATRIAGVILDDKKRAEVGLTKIYGVGRSVSRDILTRCDVDFDTKIGDLSEDTISRLRTIIEKEVPVEGDLRREVVSNIQRLKQIKAYRGIRHSRGLPVRGQRTKTNSRTVRGNKRTTMGSGRTSVTKT